MGRRHEQTFLQRRHPDVQQTHEKMLIITNHQGNANQNHNEVSPHFSEWLKSKTQEITGVGEDVEKQEPHVLLEGMQTGAALFSTVWSLFKKLKIELPYDLLITLLGIYPKNTRTLIQSDTHAPLSL